MKAEEKCLVCGSSDGVEYLSITMCNLCKKCQDDLKEGFEEAAKMDHEDTPDY